MRIEILEEKSVRKLVAQAEHSKIEITLTNKNITSVSVLPGHWIGNDFQREGGKHGVHIDFDDPMMRDFVQAIIELKEEGKIQ